MHAKFLSTYFQVSNMAAFMLDRAGVSSTCFFENECNESQMSQAQTRLRNHFSHFLICNCHAALDRREPNVAC